MRLKLTKKGQELLTRTLNREDTIDFYLIKLGDGEWTENDKIEEAESIKEHFLDVEINALPTTSTNEDGDKFIDLLFVFNNSEIEADHRITEIGVFARNKANESILYAVGYEDESTANYVPSKNDRPLEFELQVSVYIGDSENVTATINESLATATKQDIKIHIEDKHNPHNVTKEQIGLSNIENLKFGDQVHEFSEANELSNINSGEKLSVITGKIKKAITSLINHLNNKDNPHAITATKISAAKEEHSHSAQEIKSGVLSVTRGGSGKSKFDKKAVILGNDNEAFDSVKGTGAFFSYGDAAGPKFDTLPVNMGGTGLTKGASFVSESTLIEGSYGCYGSVILPGGLLVQWGRLKVDRWEYGTEIEFIKSYKNERYAIVFTTQSSRTSGQNDGLGTTPNWRMPAKSVDRFFLEREATGTERYADWVAFGEAEVTE